MASLASFLNNRSSIQSLFEIVASTNDEDVDLLFSDHFNFKIQTSGMINYLITESEVVTGKAQTEAGRGLRFSRNDRTVEVIKLFISWHHQQKFSDKNWMVL